MNVRYRVELNQAERAELEALLAGGKQAARKLKRAQILLAADAGLGAPRRDPPFKLTNRLIRDIWNMGFDAVRWLWHYFLLGAVLVIPIWFITRLLKAQGITYAALATALEALNIVSALGERLPPAGVDQLEGLGARGAAVA